MKAVFSVVISVPSWHISSAAVWGVARRSRFQTNQTQHRRAQRPVNCCLQTAPLPGSLSVPPVGWWRSKQQQHSEESHLPSTSFSKHLNLPGLKKNIYIYSFFFFLNLPRPQCDTNLYYSTALEQSSATWYQQWISKAAIWAQLLEIGSATSLFSFSDQKQKVLHDRKIWFIQKTAFRLQSLHNFHWLIW